MDINLRATAAVAPLSRIRTMPDPPLLISPSAAIGNQPELVVIDGASASSVQQALKRATDVVLSFMLLLVLIPVLVAIAISVRLTSDGPVIFRQVRIGWHGHPFTIYKFRTMTSGAEAALVDLRDRNDVDGPLFKIHLDPRRTRLGAVLRKLSLDELPQLFNVIKGDMSLVGPRPFVPSESAAFTGWAARRFDVRPGMTGQWQISGRNNLPFDELKRLDHQYVSEWTLWKDLWILLITPAKVVRREGAY